MESIENFLTPDVFEDRFGKTPESMGFKCQWEEKSGKKLWGCWVEDDDQPLRRQRKRVEAVAAYEELDNSDGALTADQLAKRFKAEAGAQSEANRPLARASEIKKMTAAARASSGASHSSAADPGDLSSAAPMSQGMLSRGGCGSGSSLVHSSLVASQPVPPPGNKRSFDAVSGGVSTTPKKIKQEIGAGGSGGGKSGAPGSGSDGKSNISIAQIETLAADCDKVITRVQDAQTVEELTTAEVQLNKCSKALDKKGCYRKHAQPLQHPLGLAD